MRDAPRQEPQALEPLHVPHALVEASALLFGVHPIGDVAGGTQHAHASVGFLAAHAEAHVEPALLPRPGDDAELHPFELSSDHPGEMFLHARLVLGGDDQAPVEILQLARLVAGDALQRAGRPAPPHAEIGAHAQVEAEVRAELRDDAVALGLLGDALLELVAASTQRRAHLLAPGRDLQRQEQGASQNPGTDQRPRQRGPRQRQRRAGRLDPRHRHEGRGERALGEAGVDAARRAVHQPGGGQHRGGLDDQRRAVGQPRIPGHPEHAPRESEGQRTGQQPAWDISPRVDERAREEQRGIGAAQGVAEGKRPAQPAEQLREEAREDDREAGADPIGGRSEP